MPRACGPRLPLLPSELTPSSPEGLGYMDVSAVAVVPTHVRSCPRSPVVPERGAGSRKPFPTLQPSGEVQTSRRVLASRLAGGGLSGVVSDSRGHALGRVHLTRWSRKASATMRRCPRLGRLHAPSHMMSGGGVPLDGENPVARLPVRRVMSQHSSGSDREKGTDSGECPDRGRPVERDPRAKARCLMRPARSVRAASRESGATRRVGADGSGR